MEIWTLAWDSENEGTGASVHMTERECFEELIRGYVEPDMREEALKQLELDGTIDEAGEHDFWEWFDDNARELMDTFSIDSHEINAQPTVGTTLNNGKPGPIDAGNASDLATILAALRLFQREYQDCGDERIRADWPEHFIDNNGNAIAALGSEDIDALCERLNLGPQL